MEVELLLLEEEKVSSAINSVMKVECVTAERGGETERDAVCARARYAACYAST
jgi:hypothetical protein